MVEHIRLLEINRVARVFHHNELGAGNCFAGNANDLWRYERVLFPHYEEHWNLLRRSFHLDGGTKGSGGLLSKLAFWRKDEPIDLTKLPQYQVQIKEAKGDASEVKVLGKDGAPESSDTSKKILSLLYNQLK